MVVDVVKFGSFVEEDDKSWEEILEDYMSNGLIEPETNSILPFAKRQLGFNMEIYQ